MQCVQCQYKGLHTGDTYTSLLFKPVLYSFDFQKYTNVSCCGLKHTPPQFQVLVIQRQPTPYLDEDRGQHVLSKVSNLSRPISKSAITNLKYVPSNMVDTKIVGTMHFRLGRKSSYLPSVRLYVSHK